MKTCAKIEKTSINVRIIKTGYTSTCNEYKWAIKYKYIIIKCNSLLVQIYTQVLTKTTSKHVNTTWSTKYDHLK